LVCRKCPLTVNRQSSIVNRQSSIAIGIVRAPVVPIARAIAIAVTVGPVRHAVAICIASAITVTARVSIVAAVDRPMAWPMTGSIIVRHIADATGQADSGSECNDKLFHDVSSVIDISFVGHRSGAVGTLAHANAIHGSLQTVVMTAVKR
jgi:hypothetical protein